MPRPYGHWSDEDLAGEIAIRQSQIADTERAIRQHDSQRPKRVDLAYSHTAMVLSSEALSLAQDLTSLNVEVQLREQGTWQRFDSPE